MTETRVDVEAASAVQPVAEAPTTGPQPPVAMPETSSPVSEAPREPKPETVALATFDDLMGKAKRVDEPVINLPQPDGTVKAAKLRLEAVQGPEYDALIDRCRPTREQAVRQLQYNPDTFEPLLLSVVVTAPRLTEKQWSDLRQAKNWSGGEFASLVLRAQALCMQGLDVPFSVSG